MHDRLLSVPCSPRWAPRYSSYFVVRTYVAGTSSLLLDVYMACVCSGGSHSVLLCLLYCVCSWGPAEAQGADACLQQGTRASGILLHAGLHCSHWFVLPAVERDTHIGSIRDCGPMLHVDAATCDVSQHAAVTYMCPGLQHALSTHMPLCRTAPGLSFLCNSNDMQSKASMLQHHQCHCYWELLGSCNQHPSALWIVAPRGDRTESKGGTCNVMQGYRFHSVPRHSLLHRYLEAAGTCRHRAAACNCPGPTTHTTIPYAAASCISRL